MITVKTLHQQLSTWGMYTPGGMPTTERGTHNFKFNIWFSIEEYIQTYVQQPPLGPEKRGRLKEAPDKI